MLPARSYKNACVYMRWDVVQECVWYRLELMFMFPTVPLCASPPATVAPLGEGVSDQVNGKRSGKQIQTKCVNKYLASDRCCASRDQIKLCE